MNRRSCCKWVCLAKFVLRSDLAVAVPIMIQPGRDCIRDFCIKCCKPAPAAGVNNINGINDYDDSAAGDDTAPGCELRRGGGDIAAAGAEQAGVRLPSSCRNGTCRTCLCLMSGGSVTYRIEWPGLSLDEKREGYILPCVALAQSDLTLLVPAARMIV